MSDKIDKIREYLDNFKERIDDLSLPKDELKIISLFLEDFELVLEQREAIFALLEIVKERYDRMSSMIGTEDDDKISQTLQFVIEKG